jgi:1-acyl-sn-glycerol-3-phosphate acyltransferase
MADLFLLALFSGFYSVPLYAVIQARAEISHRARIIAANNILNALFIIVASLMATALLRSGSPLPQLFLVVGLMNAAVAAYIYFLVPEFLMRFICWLLIHSVYRLEKRGLENIPEEGPAVLACNHVSFVDPLVILAASPRPIRFVMDHRIFKIPVLSFVFRTGKAIPIAPAKEDEALMNAAFDRVAEALAEGELVGIFPEGASPIPETCTRSARHPRDRRAHTGPGGADGAQGTLGQLLQPRRRRRDDAAIPARGVLAHRARGRKGALACGGDTGYLQAAVAQMRGDRK